MLNPDGSKAIQIEEWIIGNLPFKIPTLHFELVTDRGPNLEFVMPKKQARGFINSIESSLLIDHPPRNDSE